MADWLAVKAEHAQWAEADRHKATAANPDLHPSSRARADRALAQREKREQREGNHADRVIATWEATIDAVIADPEASAVEHRKGTQIKTICTEGLRPIPNGSDRLQKVLAAQRIVEEVVLYYIERRTVQRAPRDTPLSIPSALLRATAPAPQSHNPSARAPDRGPPAKDCDNDEPPLDARLGEAPSAPDMPRIAFADAGSASGPALVAYLERRSLLPALHEEDRVKGNERRAQQLRRWRVAGSRVAITTVDELMITVAGEPASVIRADEPERVWRLEKAHAARTVTHGDDARQYATSDLMAAA